MSQAQLIPSSNSPLPPIAYKGLPVITTERLAQVYGCSAKNIRDNFSNNRERFIEGKHFFHLTNGDLKDFRDYTENFGVVVMSTPAVSLTEVAVRSQFAAVAMAALDGALPPEAISQEYPNRPRL